VKTGGAKSAGKRRGIWILAGVLFLGFILRVFYLIEIVDNPDFASPTIDPSYHDYWARGLVTGDWIVPSGEEDPQVFRHPFYRPPGYPYFLSLIYRIRMDYLAPRIANMIIGLASSLLAFFLGRRWWGRAAGLVFAALMATYWAFIYFEGELVGEPATVFLGLWLLLVISRLAEKATFLRCLLGGLILGLYALFRPNVLLFLPFLALWLLWVLRRRERASLWWKTAPGLVLGTVIMLVPPTIRNLAVSGELVPLTTNLGVSLAVANNEVTDGTIHIIPGIEDLGTPFDWPRIVRRLERISGRDLTHREASSYLVDQALDYIRENPGGFLGLLGKKTLFFWGPREIGNLKEIYFARKYSPVLSSIPLNFPLVLALSLVGFFLLFLENRKVSPADTPRRRRWEVTVLLIVFTGSYFFSMLPFAAAARYRVPVIPFLLCFGAYAISALGGKFARREWRGALLWTGGAAVLFGLFSIDFAGYRPKLDRWHYDLALAYTDREEWESAIREYEEVIRLQPTAIRAWNNLGNIYTLREDYPRAAECYRQVILLRPDIAHSYNNLGSVLFRMDRLDEALQYFQTALRLRPDMAESHNNVGNVYFRKGEHERAVESYREALRFKPLNASIHFNLGKVRAKQGRLEEAAAHYSKALRINPDHREARENLDQIFRLEKE
jgi:tetratricopeptide (TPR) repeat protein